MPRLFSTFPRSADAVVGARGFRSSPALRTAVLSAVLCALASAPATAQRPQFRALTADDGLTSSQIAAMSNDSQGFIWLGTRKGLNRYDGGQFTVYRHRAGDPASLPVNDITVIYEDGKKTLWVGTPGGLSRYDRERDAFVTYAIVPGDSVAVTAIHDADGTLWVGTGRGLYTFDRATNKATPYKGADFGTFTIQTILLDRAKHLWVGSKGGGAKELDPKGGVIRTWTLDPANPTGPTSLQGDDVRDLLEDESGTMWLAIMNGGLAEVGPSRASVRRYQHDPSDPGSMSINVGHSLLSDGARGMWVGTENGGLDYLEYATRKFEHNKYDPSNPTSLNSNSIWSLLRDPNGSIWVGTFAGGVNISRQNGNAIRRYRSIAGDVTSLSFNSVMGFLEDSKGRMWVATDGGGLDRFDRAAGKFTTYSTRTSNLNSDAVLGITEDRQGKLWIATWAGGISRFDPETHQFTAFTPKNSGMLDDAAFAIHTARDGQVWIGTNLHGLQRVDPATGKFTSYLVAKSGAESQIRVITETSDGMLLLGTDLSGMVEFDPRTGNKRWFAAGKDGISANHVQAILESEPGVAWVGTQSGLDRVDRRTGKVVHFTEADGLSGSAVSGLEMDAAHRLWVSGDHGITRFDPATKKVKIYTVADGLQGSEYNAATSYRAKDGALLFGGAGGFNLLDIERITENAHVPPVVLTGFQLYNKDAVIGAKNSPLESSITVAKKVVLHHDQSAFTIDFAALDFAAPDKNQYAYKLEGLDDDWNQVGTKRSASYTNLPAGSYTFRVKGTNNDGVWNETGASVEIKVVPAFWASWWFRLLVLIAAGAVIRYLVRVARDRRETLEQSARRDRESQQYLERNVIEVLAAMERFSEGDLSVALSVDKDDSIGRLRGGFNTAVVNIRTIVKQVRDVLDSTVHTSRQIHGQSEGLARGAEEQISQTVLVASAAQQMAQSVSGSAQSIAEASEIAQRSGTEAHEGARIVRETFGAMDGIVDTIGSSARAVEALGKSADQIGAITRVIDQIADQTELLALNAAIEAARAGRHGRTFAIVALEVQKLAERTAQATSEIARVIQQNQAEVQSAVAAMGQIGGQVADGREMVDRAGVALDGIITNAERMLACIQQVRASSEEQSATTAHISENIETISSVTHSAVTGNQTIATSVQELNTLIDDLQTRVARFHFEAAPPVAIPASGVPEMLMGGRKLAHAS